MNYPLGTAILGFVGGAHLDMDVIAAPRLSTAGSIQPLDGPAFARRLEALMTAYDPAVVAVQLNLIGSHDTPAGADGAAATTMRPLRPGDRPPGDPARRAVHLLRRRDRHGRRSRPGQPAGTASPRAMPSAMPSVARSSILGVRMKGRRLVARP